jgi:AcrR family transcriptional regulator
VPRAGLAPAAVIAAGVELADEVGYTTMTMGLLAERLGVRTPSLYKHVDSLEALRRGVAVQAKRDFTDAIARVAVGVSGADAVRAFATAYRRWAITHPGRYAATLRAPAPDDEEDRRVSDQALQIMYDVLAGFGLRGEHAVDAARALRSTLHGFVTLEAGGGFGLTRDVDRSYTYLVDTLIAAMTAQPADTPADLEYHGPVTS